ncbi:MAG: ABC transporter substrate-binding protein [Blautia sp.]|nr:ABC transporter substrate-binding protein [Blautia sp.]
MRKKILSLLLIAALSLGMTTGLTISASADQLEKADDGTAAQEAAQERIESGDYPTIVMAFMTWAGKLVGTDRISEKISEITREKIGVNVELMPMDSASYAQNMNLILASGEQVDLFNVVTLGMMACVNKGYLLDLEEDDLLATYGQGIIDAFNTVELGGCRVAGTLYGIPVKKDDAAGRFGMSIPVEYLDAIGFDYASMYANEEDEIIYTDFETIEDILGRLHEQYPDKTTFYMDPTSIIGQCLLIDSPNDNFGVLLDPANSLVIEDLFSSDLYMDLCSRMYRWNQNGWISPDAITETNATTTQVKAGSLCAYKTATKPGIRQQESNLCGKPVVIFQLGEDFKASNTYLNMPWAINQNCEDPVAAMQLLNLFYTDPDISTLICWGEEGKEWKETGDGHITFMDGVDAQNSEYYNNVNWQMPNQFIARIWEGDSLDLWERMQAYNDNAVTSKAMGFTFDNSDLAAEYTAMTNVYSEYSHQLELGFLDPEVGIPELVDRLKAAGLEDYMAEKQAQLDAWAEANGVE